MYADEFVIEGKGGPEKKLSAKFVTTTLGIMGGILMILSN